MIRARVAAVVSLGMASIGKNPCDTISWSGTGERRRLMEGAHDERQTATKSARAFTRAKDREERFPKRQRAGRLGLAGLFGSLRSRGLYDCPLAGSIAVVGGVLAPPPVVAGLFCGAFCGVF
jgi:hypothetical protein